MRRFLVQATVAVVLAAGCRQPAARPGRVPDAKGPTVPATILTVQTTLQPSNRTSAHNLYIAGSKARSTDEGPRWRLYDLGRGTVTFVNDLDATYRTEPIETVMARRRATLRRPVDRELPKASFEQTGERRDILGMSAEQAVVRLGGYQRELWFGRHQHIPDGLFAAMHGTAEPSTRLGAIVAEVDEALSAVRGFPLLDRAEMPYGQSKMSVERRVTSIRRRDIPLLTLEIPVNYKPVTEPGASRPPVSSPPPGQTAPAAGSPPSSTTRTAP